VQHRTVRNGYVVRTGAYRWVVSRPKETSSVFTIIIKVGNRSADEQQKVFLAKPTGDAAMSMMAERATTSAAGPA